MNSFYIQTNPDGSIEIIHRVEDIITGSAGEHHSEEYTICRIESQEPMKIQIKPLLTGTTQQLATPICNQPNPMKREGL